MSYQTPAVPYGNLTRPTPFTSSPTSELWSLRSVSRRGESVKAPSWRLSESDLPPRVSPNDIPGTQDDPWERVYNLISDDCGMRGWDNVDAIIAWKVGVKLMRLVRKEIIEAMVRYDRKDDGR